ncbi:MAG: carbamate kinase [Chloroflexi bacterium]|nr:carbamate kinase [Chloroflexota bacterium]MCI0578331.1 carbamate kinase [Chloroflexota bacterium]MCI0649001.1 carbamate kinase [Chloroflexota bacterium]MCI0729436.1 carbamate kinase [Chloroflexota bacterium]
MAQIALVAIGGNSLITDKNRPDVPHQWEAVRETCRHLANMVEAGWQLVITHGNGPQVGYILRRNELAAHAVHTTPLDLIVADTQGAIGYMLQQALGNELYSRGIARPVVSVVTQVLVDQNDAAFAAPSKPIGGFMSETEARQFEAGGWRVIEDAGRGWRRVVASPEPLRIIEEGAIRSLLAAGCIVAAVGGGGIPVVQNPSGELRELRGVYAVIDKDRASGLLACQLQVDLFLISTGVEKVAIHFNTPEQQNLSELTVGEAETYMAQGHFAAGSMQPKIEAVVDFVRETGNPALITDPPNIARALRRETGTWVH